MIFPIVCGVLAGGCLIGAMAVTGMLKERSGLAILVGAIALFYPVFAIQAQVGTIILLLHLAIFSVFSIFAVYGFYNGAGWLAAALVLHGVFDAIAMWTGHPGPNWWPAFCAALDVTAGLVLLLLLQKERDQNDGHI